MRRFTLSASTILGHRPSIRGRRSSIHTRCLAVCGAGGVVAGLEHEALLLPLRALRAGRGLHRRQRDPGPDPDSVHGLHDHRAAARGSQPAAVRRRRVSVAYSATAPSSLPCWRRPLSLASSSLRRCSCGCCSRAGIGTSHMQRIDPGTASILSRSARSALHRTSECSRGSESTRRRRVWSRRRAHERPSRAGGGAGRGGGGRDRPVRRSAIHFRGTRDERVFFCAGSSFARPDPRTRSHYLILLSAILLVLERGGGGWSCPCS